jgi:hypothetical protein
MKVRAVGVCWVLCVACGGAPVPGAGDPAGEQAASDPVANPETSESLAKAAPEPAPAEAPAAEPAPAPPANEAPVGPPKEPPAADKNAPREVSYRVTPDGLVIEVDGVELRPRAKSIKSKGGFGVEVTLDVTANKLRYLSNPENGPLAFAGNVIRKGEKTHFGDERKGSDAVNIEPGVKKTFTRTYPGKGQQPLWWGEELELEAGLWGVGNDGERRPIKKLFKLKMVARDGAPPVISPPID